MPNTKPDRDAVDTLAEQLRGIEQCVREMGLTMVSGWVEPGKGITTVHWRSDGTSSTWRDFLAQARALGAGVVIANVSRPPLEELEVDLTADEQRSRREHVGHVAAIELYWVAPSQPGIIFVWRLDATWFDPSGEKSEELAPWDRNELIDAEVTRLAAKLAQHPEFQLVKDRDEREAVAKRLLPPDALKKVPRLHHLVSEAGFIVESRVKKSPEVRELAMRLAKDERFQRARNFKQKLYAAEQVLGAEVAAHRPKLHVVVEEATTIHDVDLRKGKRPAR